MTNAHATLDNPVWYALTTQQAAIALGDHLARRYPPEIAPFGAVAAYEARPYPASAIARGCVGITSASASGPDDL